MTEEQINEWLLNLAAIKECLSNEIEEPETEEDNGEVA